MTSAASERRRTRCVYCGDRIPGVLHPSDYPSAGPERQAKIAAARIACLRHWRLVQLDPAYNFNVYVSTPASAAGQTLEWGNGDAPDVLTPDPKMQRSVALVHTRESRASSGATIA